ncbi:precorrin-2 dehydrogenase/sirohydrochlorin ferrochelatase family protein [Phnomibacter ginsenosidimutans]|uniref:precorrin-2 dehydrogenase/sirohydrochlorin ferrochelatase family protein n=1 Tax=Phnomibacter ginsenosidimutans TaxID=2676868 RepID=UPI0018D1F78D|nr:NAD(P)-dependent oxidoreductase [Phnomibacter ginsenosidimutans]
MSAKLLIEDEVASAKEFNPLFPVFVKLEQMRVLVIGAGPVGTEKLQAILSNSPRTNITVLAEVFSPGMQQLLQQHPHIQQLQASYSPTHLSLADVVMVAVNNRALAEDIYYEAKQQHKWVNVADTPDLCDFYLSSVVKKGR